MTYPRMKDSKNYQSWMLAQDKPSLTTTAEEKLAHIELCGTLAVSIHNTQPWQFVREKDSILVSVNPGQRLPLADPTGRNIYISLGCCLANMEIAAHAMGSRTAKELRLASATQYQIRIRFRKQEGEADDLTLYEAIPRRYSNKLKYNGQEIPRAVLHSLSETVGATNAKIVQNAHHIRQIADIMEQTTVGFSHIPGFNRELANWLRPSDTDEFDGMPGFIVGYNQEQSIALRQEIMANADYLAELGKKDGNALRSSPAVGLVLINDETPNDWVAAGVAYQRLSLAATAMNLCVTPMQALIEYAPSFELVRSIVKVDQPAAMFFRMGYADNEPYHTPRKPTSEFFQGPV